MMSLLSAREVDFLDKIDMREGLKNVLMTNTICAAIWMTCKIDVSRRTRYDIRRNPHSKPTRRHRPRGGHTMGPSKPDYLSDDLDFDPSRPHCGLTRHKRWGFAEHPASAAHGKSGLNLPDHQHSDSYFGLCHGITDGLAWHMEPCGHIVSGPRTLMFDGECFPQERVAQPGGDCGHDTWAIAVLHAEMRPSQCGYMRRKA